MVKAVVVDKNYGSVSHDKLNELQAQYQLRGMELRLEHYESPEAIISGCQDVDAILATGNPPVNRQVLEALPKLKLVQRFGIGVNSIDLEAATEQGVLALYMPGFCLKELADHATALILGLIRNVGMYDRGIRAGNWPKAKGPIPKNIREMTLGLFGFGGSARELYKIFKNGFGTRILVTDPFLQPGKLDGFDIELVSFEAMLKASDVISINAPLTPETKHLFNKTVFAQMKADSILINIARGELVQQDDLIEALEAGTIGFAGLDVFAAEPMPENCRLRHMDNVLLTPHSAFYGVEAQKNQLGFALELVDGALNKACIKSKYIANQGVSSKINGLKII